jgi:hypothetical protein
MHKAVNFWQLIAGRLPGYRSPAVRASGPRPPRPAQATCGAAAPDCRSPAPVAIVATTRREISSRDFVASRAELQW